MIVYGSTMNLSIPKMFIGSVIPGVIIAALYIVVNMIIAYRSDTIRAETVKYTLGEILVATLRAVPLLLLPVIVLGGIYGGVFTPTEAATVCVVGCLMETLSSIVILTPLLIPIGVELGADPLHLGVVFCITLVVGFITPPFGINLFTAVSTTETSYVDVVKGVLPFMVVALLTCILFAFFPQIILFLPELTYGAN